MRRAWHHRPVPDATAIALPLPPAQAGSNAPLLVGFSGGLDSTVLLHLLAATPAIRARGLEAVHVHHDLHPAADDWAEHCAAVCRHLGVPLEVMRVRVDRDAGYGREAAARAARHGAFAEALPAGGILALAHHRRDQAETFLLRGLRGSGVGGLAAIPTWRAFAGGWLWRPLLDQPRERLLGHARGQGLQWIEDPANEDESLDRNFLRHRVLPLLRERWPQAEAALARSAALCGEADALLAGEDRRALEEARREDDTLSLPALRALDPARRGRALRLWIDALELPPLPAEGVARIEADLLHARPDGSAAFAWSGAVVRAWRQRLHAGVPRPPLPPGWQAGWDGLQPLRLPDGSSLFLADAAMSAGMEQVRATFPGFEIPMSVHARRGGERIRLPGRSHSHALKHVLQEAGIPPWERTRLPLLSNVAGEVQAAGDRIVSAGFADRLRALGLRLVHLDP
jgi:tRNA(Ile)-lysidine synthase